MAVLRKGVLQQVATPREIYDAPENLFVAGFMGSPAINLMTASVEGEKLRVPMADIPLDDRMREALSKTERRPSVVVGLRPEHLFDAALVDGASDRGVCFRTQVDVLEAMGAEYYAYSTLEDARANHQMATDGDDDDTPDEATIRPRDAQQLIARLSIDSKVCEHQPIELWFDPARLHVFDAESGKRLTGPVK